MVIKQMGCTQFYPEVSLASVKNVHVCNEIFKASTETAANKKPCEKRGTFEDVPMVEFM